MSIDSSSTPLSENGLTSIKGSTLFVGLTGGIGSGKTAVSDELSRLGAGVIDTDRIAHQITAPKGAAIPLIKTQFGSEFINSEGALIRDKMRSLVFSDPSARKTLETITHPLIRAETIRQAKLLLLSQVPYLVFVVPLLIESGNWQSLLDYLIVVDCPEEIQIERVMHRSNLSRIEVQKILAAQTGRQQRLASADIVIENHGSLDSLKADVMQLHQKILQNQKDLSSSS